VIVSGEVISEGHHWAVDSLYMQRLSDFAHSIGAIWGPVLATTSIIATRTEKKRAWATTRALAVDLESEIVARTATALGIPFIVLRSIADTARRDLPPAALVPLSADGKLDLLGVLAAVLRRPSQLAGMIGLAQETRIALSALVGPARALRGVLGTA
jgi:hypothetical protein